LINLAADLLLRPPYGIGQAIIFFPCGFYLLLFFLAYSQRSEMDIYHTSRHHVALLRIQNAGLKCAARGSLEIEDAKNRHLCTIAQLCRAVSSQLRHISTTGKKNLLKSNMSSTSSKYGELRPTNSWDRFRSLGHPSKFQRVLRLAFVTAAKSLTGGQPNFARCLAVFWAGTLCIHFCRLLPRWILRSAKFTLHPRLAFSYNGSVTAWHSSSRHQPNFAVWFKEWNSYGTFAEGATCIRLSGHHVGHQPTF